MTKIYPAETVHCSPWVFLPFGFLGSVYRQVLGILDMTYGTNRSETVHILWII